MNLLQRLLGGSAASSTTAPCQVETFSRRNLYPLPTTALLGAAGERHHEREVRAALKAGGTEPRGGPVKKRGWKLAAAVVAVTVAFAALVMTSLPSKAHAGKVEAPPTIRIGTANFPEASILGELYRQALVAKGFTVTLNGNIPYPKLISSLASGKIDLFPGYIGVIVQSVYHQTRLPATARGWWLAAKKLAAPHGFTLFQPTPFSDSEAIGVLTTTAKGYGLKTVADLKRLGSKLTIGGPPEFQKRSHGLVGLSKEYGITQAKFIPLVGINSYAAFDAGKVLAADIFCTDPYLTGTKYSVLIDTKRLFGFQNVAPVVSTTLAQTLGPRFSKAVDAVSAMLTTTAMIGMNASVAIDRQPASKVARRFLLKHGCLSVVDGCNPPPPPPPTTGTCGN
jgi:osmoprotectant transport system substrate-binding protein